jgi:thiol-disulfide isomerase/thioredoxin
MKNIKIGCFLIAAILLQQAAGQGTKPEKQFTLDGRLNGTHVDSVLVNYSDGDRKYTHISIPLINQKFTVSGTIDEPGTAVIIFKNTGEVISREQMESRRIIVYLESGTMALTGNAAKLKEIKISGSKTQSEYEELTKAAATVMAERQPVVDELMKEKDHEKQADIREKLEPYNNRIKKIIYGFFLTHPNSYVTADQMKYYISSLTQDSIKHIYNNFDAEMKASYGGKYLAAEIKKIEAGIPGNMAANFTSTDINGKPLSLNGFKGKYVIVDFWASWCVPCRKGNPHMIELYNKYHSKGLDITGVSDDDRKPELWKAAVAKDNIGIWNHVLRGLDMELAMKRLHNPKDINEEFGIHTLPTKILIDPSGKIIGRYGDNVGGTEEDMDKMIARIFKN